MPSEALTPVPPGQLQAERQGAAADPGRPWPRAWGLGLLALAMVRLLPLIVAWVRRTVAWTNGTVPALADWPSVAQITELPNLAWRLWPLLLGLLLTFWPSRRLRGAALLTVLALAVEDLSHLGLLLNFDVSPAPLLLVPRSSPWSALLAARLVCLLLAVLLGLSAWRLGYITPPADGRGTRTRGRPAAIAGRLAAVAAVLFLGLSTWASGWSVYEQVIQRSPRLRSLLAGQAQPAIPPPPPRPPTPEERALYEISSRIDSGLSASSRGDLEGARTAYSTALRGLKQLESAPDLQSSFASRQALAANNLAWLLLTWPDPDRWDPPTALNLARDAVRLAPEEGNYWNTLGVALFRTGANEEASEALNRSCQLRDGGDSVDWFFQAMIAQATGHTERARTLFDQSVAWRLQQRPRDPELWQIHAEAAKVLGQPVPDPVSLSAEPHPPIPEGLKHALTPGRSPQRRAPTQSRPVGPG